MKRLRRLVNAVRAISPLADLRFLGVPDREDMWVIRVAIKDVILIETAAGPLEKVMTETTKKLDNMSQRIIAAAHAAAQDSDEPDSSIPPPPPTPRVLPKIPR